jgi:hypothetical protein
VRCVVREALQFLKIIVLGIVAAIVYGVVLDLVAVRISLEYFTLGHPPVFSIDSATLLALGWGVISTWWMGAMLGLLLALAARVGPRPRVRAGELWKPVLLLLAITACASVAAGAMGFVLASNGLLWLPAGMSDLLSADSQKAFMADWWADTASAATAAIGGVVLCVRTLGRRARMENRNQ